MLHRTLIVLTGLALVSVLLLLVALLWLKRRAFELLGAKVLPPECPTFWPAIRPQPAG